ncbi:hypothetical protein BOX15_Mlig021966g2 [Macrostomum lignano]|uniref:GPS domain-containing protein n=2 Tax=Macrostomum lignano TaxID=282301 RepID=A0A267EDK2_9PLAT|nr:hypothetical protein BOX15_Mlig021966g2 [Macrostomum lignano]
MPLRHCDIKEKILPHLPIAMLAVTKLQYQLFCRSILLRILILTFVSSSAVRLNKNPCSEVACTMTIEPGDTFEPQCNKFVGFMLLMEPGKKVTFQKKAEPELSNSPFDLETIDSTGDCSLSAENFTQALQRKTDCFVADRGGYFNCQIKNPKSVSEALYHGCFSEKRILNGSYNCINSSSTEFTLTTKQPSMLEQKLPTSNPQSDRRDGAGRFETPCATCSTTESPRRNSCSTYEGSERSYLDANGECQPSPANLKELNLTMNSDLADSQKATVLLEYAQKNIDSAKSMKEFTSLLNQQLTSNTDSSTRTIANLLKTVGTVADMPLWRAVKNLTDSDAKDLAETAASVIDAVDSIGFGLAASATQDFSIDGGDGGVALSFVRLAPDRGWTTAQPDSRTQLKLTANLVDSSGQVTEADNRTVVATSLDLPHLIGSLPDPPGNAPETSGLIATRIVQASLFGSSDGPGSRRLTEASVLAVLPHLSGRQWVGVHRTCAYLRPGTGLLDSHGCRVVPELSSAVKTACLCNHLSSFAVVVSPSDSWATIESKQLLMEHSVPLAVLTYVCLGLSILCLLLTCVTYAAVRVKTQAADHSIATLHRVHSCLSACLLGAHAFFLAGFEGGTTFGALACKIVSGAAVYLFLAVFCWLLCEGFMYTKSLIVVLPGVDSTFAKVKFRHYCLLSILAPAAILVPVALIRSDQMIQYRPNLEGHSASLEEPSTCWLSDRNGTYWAFLGPVLFVCAVNLAIFVAILVKLSRRDLGAGGDGGGCNGYSGGMEGHFGLGEFMRRQVKLSITLASLLGLTWLLCILFFFAQGRFLLAAHYLFVLLTGLQGCFIFATQIAAHERIREAWERRLLSSGGRCLPSSLRRCLERRRTDRMSGACGKQQQLQQQKLNSRSKSAADSAAQGNSKSDSHSMAPIYRGTAQTEEVSFVTSSPAAAAPPGDDRQRAEPIKVAMATTISLGDIQCACGCGSANDGQCDNGLDEEDWHTADIMPPVAEA